MSSTIATPTLLTHGSSSTDSTGAAYATASVSPVDSALLLLFIEHSKASAPDVVSGLTGTNAFNVTWTEVVNRQFNTNASPLNNIDVWWGIASGTTAGTITPAFGGNTQTGACWHLIQITTGFLASLPVRGSNRINTFANSTPTTLSAPFGGAFNDANNIGVMAFGMSAIISAPSTPASTTNLGLDTTGTPTQSITSWYTAANFGTSAFAPTWTGAANVGAVGVEIQADSSGIKQVAGQVHGRGLGTQLGKKNVFFFSINPLARKLDRITKAIKAGRGLELALGY